MLRYGLAALLSLSQPAPPPPAVQAPPPGTATGLTGKPGGLIAPANPRAVALEGELLGLVNEARAKAAKPLLTMDERLRTFARRTAEQAAKGDPAARKTDEAVKSQGLAPFGYRAQFAFGKNAAAALAELRKEKSAWQAVLGDFTKVGVGAFAVDGPEPYFQLMLFLAAEPDPMAGKPGLSPGETDPVMAGAAERLKKECYDPALEDNPNLKGDALFQLVIGGDGKVSSSKLLKPLGSPYFDDCAARLIGALTFPKPYKGKPVTLNHPVRFTPPQGDKIIGKLNATEIRTAVSRGMSEVRRCYNDARKDNPTLAGKLLVAMTVLPDGSVASAEVTEDELGSPGVSACVLATLRKLRFGRPRGGGPASISVPIELRP